MSSSEYVLEMRNISKNFPGVKALDDVTLKVAPGTVHAIVGENGAGKSTLMKCVFGLYTADDGEVILNGQPVSFASTKQALDAGIAMIQQELLPVLQRSVMENFWLGRFPEKNYGIIKIVDEKKMYADCKAVFDDLRLNIDPATKVFNLSASKIQSMEIAQAVSHHSKVIIMDEPTSSLTENEVEHLFTIIRKLKDQGIAIVYISHRIEEIFEISDEVTIMRDGKCVGTYPTKQLTPEFVIKQMVGRTLTNMFPPRENTPDGVVLKVENLTSVTEHSFRDITFDVKKGEIFGIGGLVGAQRSELVEALFGLRSVKSGTVSIDGKKVVITSPIQAKQYKMALLTEERRATGIFPVLSVLDNTIMASIGRYVHKSGLLDEKTGRRDAGKIIDTLRVKTPSLATLIENLSGGNQQKVIVARWLLTQPDILILDEPTRGIDVGTKYEIYSIIADLAKKGKTIIMISSEMPELIGMSDRIMVMCEGRVTGILDGKEATQERIMTLATQLM
ncbi:sugar ABC transporter ATP-binding protein [Candidatus Cryosericum terrychapinii]|jgi:methyl-galactoside transport system ATP-binding protein|uniref:Ribose/galactose/methyl galactoside import ATP-binding protein n=1 Tax=Candidatus Cryosericum terrychapinii TaxID=2290919 RepID=A0A398D231_9BACT|nr:sugar ABC transporter ATP-binding protein [Candidatus Cryosericum terrychapinii]RIE05551.1 sugar ABC transporter ATP-binding protein [Candidatus Cryosericum terrychapinii]